MPGGLIVEEVQIGEIAVEEVETPMMMKVLSSPPS